MTVAEELEISALLTLLMSNDKWAQLKEHVTADSASQPLMNLTADGWPKFKVSALCSPH